MVLLFDIFFLHTGKVSDLTLKVLVEGFINTHFVQIYWLFMSLFASIEEGKRIELLKYLFVVGFINPIASFSFSSRSYVAFEY